LSGSRRGMPKCAWKSNQSGFCGESGCVHTKNAFLCVSYLFWRTKNPTKQATRSSLRAHVAFKCAYVRELLLFGRVPLCGVRHSARSIWERDFCTRKHGISNSYAFNVRPLLDFGRRCALLLVSASHCLRRVDAFNGSENSALCKLPKCLPIGMKN